MSCIGITEIEGFARRGVAVVNASCRRDFVAFSRLLVFRSSLPKSFRCLLLLESNPRKLGLGCVRRSHPLIYALIGKIHRRPAALDSPTVFKVLGDLASHLTLLPPPPLLLLPAMP